MKNLFFLLLFTGILFASCKDDSDRAQVISLNPEKPILGEETSIIGKNFSSGEYSISINHLKYPVKFISDTELRFTLPIDMLDDIDKPSDPQPLILATLVISEATVIDGIYYKVIRLGEPKGWFQQRKFKNRNIDILKHLTATSDTTIWCVGDGTERSIDGGNKWTSGPGPSSMYEHLACFIDNNIVWLPNILDGQTNTSTSYSSIIYTTDYWFNFIKADTPTEPEFAVDFLFPESGTLYGTITGLWAKNYNTGLMMKRNGILIGFSGGFSAGFWKMVYQNTDLELKALSAVSMDEFSIFAIDRHTKSPKLVYQKGSTAKVYDLGQDIQEVEQIQHMPDGTVYLNDKKTKKIYRISWPFSTSQLPHEADVFHFVNNSLGYAVLANTIYKTKDGGKSWQKEFVADETYYMPTGITEHSGHVWVMLRGDNIGYNKQYILVKYNP